MLRPEERYLRTILPMRKKDLRRQIAAEAAKLLASGREADFTTAKRRAARILGVRFSVTDFPTTREIRDAVRRIDELSDSGRMEVNLRRMRVAALRLMRAMKNFRPKLVGGLVAGEATTGLETTIDLASPTLSSVVDAFVAASAEPLITEHTSPDSATSRLGILHLSGDYPVKLRIFASEDDLGEGLGIEDLEVLLDHEAEDFEAEVEGIEAASDRFEVMADLVAALENIRLESSEHPEGDSLYHSLQLFDLAVKEQPYDEEFLSAALLHDVGRIGRGANPIREAAKLLHQLVTHRTVNLITGLELALSDPPATRTVLRDIVGDDDVEDVTLLAQLDRKARQRGVATSSIDEAINYLRDLESGSLWA